METGMNEWSTEELQKLELHPKTQLGVWSSKFRNSSTYTGLNGSHQVSVTTHANINQQLPSTVEKENTEAFNATKS